MRARQGGWPEVGLSRVVLAVSAVQPVPFAPMQQKGRKMMQMENKRDVVPHRSSQRP